jgi:hypothetical protein
VFSDTTSTYGGGISIWTNSPTVNISDCTFHQCSATVGGGIDYSGSALSIYRCCFSLTVAVQYGTAIDFFSGSGTVSVRSTNFVGCHDTEKSGCWGTIADDFGADSDYNQLNFSNCELRGSDTFGEGSVLTSRRDSGRWSFSFSTIYGCVGFSAIQNNCGQVCELSFTNIYNNVIPEGSGVIFCQTVGILMKSCIFNNNSAKFFIDRYSPGSGFHVLHSIFSDDLPVASYYEETVGNYVNRETASISLGHFDTFHCPAARSFLSCNITCPPTFTFTSFPQISRIPGISKRCAIFTFPFLESLTI